MAIQYHYVVIAVVDEDGQTRFVLEGDLSDYQEDGLFVYDDDEDCFRNYNDTEDVVDDTFNRVKIKEALRTINT